MREQLLVIDNLAMVALERDALSFTRNNGGKFVPVEVQGKTRVGFVVDDQYDPHSYSFWPYVHGLVIPLRPGAGNSRDQEWARKMQDKMRQLSGVQNALFVLIVPDRSEGTTNRFLPLSPADLEKDEARLRDEYNNASVSSLHQAMKEAAYLIKTGRVSITW